MRLWKAVPADADFLEEVRQEILNTGGGHPEHYKEDVEGHARLRSFPQSNNKLLTALSPPPKSNGPRAGPSLLHQRDFSRHLDVDQLVKNIFNLQKTHRSLGGQDFHNLVIGFFN